MCRITSIARRSPAPEPAAWQPSTPSASSNRPDCSIIKGFAGIERRLEYPGRGRQPHQSRRSVMARVCQVTGKGPMVGNNVSHANNKTKRRFLPNLQYRRFWVENENRWVRLRVSSAALRLIDKNGIDSVLADMRARGQA